MIGFFGKVGQNGITQIGILNKRIDCNEQKQEVVNEEKSKLTLILIEKSDYLAIAGGVLALILLMICVKACDRNDNRVQDEASSSASVKVREIHISGVDGIRDH